MGFQDIFSAKLPSASELPVFVRDVKDIGRVRVARLQGDVGKGIGAEVTARTKVADEVPSMYERPLLLDFAGTTGWDFSTVSYLVMALAKRKAAKAPVGIINAPPQLLAGLQIAKLQDLFLVFDSEARALAELSQER